MRCCIYARVSTEEQAERDLSIPFQLERCRYHAQGKCWVVVKEFVDAGESARTDKRPEFQKMIASATAKEFDVILVHKFDRFARNDYDFIVYEKELEELGISLESVSEPGDASTPAGYISRRMMQVISTWYSKNLAVETRKGLKKLVEKGGWPKLAPPGYINSHDKNSAWIEVDPQMGPFITRAFTEMATGKWTLREWANYAYSSGYRSRKGFRISLSTWGKIFHNRFYLGETWLRKEDLPTRGNHEPLTDETTFARAQQVLKARHNYKQRPQRHKYLLQRLLYSEDTGTTCLAETHPRKRISYYRTKGKSNGRQVFYNTRDIEGQLPTVFKAVKIDEQARGQLKQDLDSWFAAESGSSGELLRAQTRLAKLERMEKNLQQLIIEEDICFKDFKEHRARIEAERANLKSLVNTISYDQGRIRADFEIALQLASELDFLFAKGNIDERRLLCETVFKRLSVRNGKIVGVELNPPFTLIASRGEGSVSLLNREPDFRPLCTQSTFSAVYPQASNISDKPKTYNVGCSNMNWAWHVIVEVVGHGKSFLQRSMTQELKLCKERSS
jgi:DNA invertase Pin-like site-specific DNA recombinase